MLAGYFALKRRLARAVLQGHLKRASGTAACHLFMHSLNSAEELVVSAAGLRVAVVNYWVC